MSTNYVQKATGTSPSGLTDSLIFDDGSKVGVGVTTPSSRLHVLATTEQLRLGYDSTNYISATVASTGSVAVNGNDGAVVRFTGGTAPLSFTTPEGSSAATPVDLAVRFSNPGVDPGRMFGRSLIMTEVNDPVDLRVRNAETKRSISSLTRSGSTATATTSGNHNLVTGTRVTISGANQSEYNGTFVITVTGSATFTYSVTGSPATPATGTIFMGGERGSHSPFAKNTDPGTVAGKLHYDMLQVYTDPTWKEFALVEARVKQYRADGDQIFPADLDGVSFDSHPGELYARVYPEHFDESIIRALFSGDGTISIGGGGYGADGLPNSNTACLNVYGGGIVLRQVAKPVAPTVAPIGGTGSTQYTYRIVAFDVAGRPSPVSDPTSISNGLPLNQLDNSKYNQISWPEVTGAEYYYILRTTLSTDSFTDKALVATVGPGTDASVSGFGICSLGSGDNLRIIRADGTTKAFKDRAWANTGSFSAEARNATGDLDIADGAAITVNAGARVIVGNNNIKMAVDNLPNSDNTYNLGASSLRWANTYTVQAHVGDLILSNDFVFTEHYNLEGEVPRGVALIDDQDLENPRLLAFFDETGTIYATGVRSLTELGAVTVRPWSWRVNNPAPPRPERPRRSPSAEPPLPEPEPEPPSGIDYEARRTEEASYPILSGRVRTANGPPVRGATVEVTSGRFVGMSTRTTGDEPTYRLRLRGEATIRASMDGYAPQEISVTIESDQRVDFSLQRL